MSHVGPSDHDHDHGLDHGLDHLPKPEPKTETYISAIADPRLSKQKNAGAASPPSTTTPAPATIAVQNCLKSESRPLTTASTDIPHSPTPSMTHPSNPSKPSDALAAEPPHMSNQSLAAEPVSLPQIHSSPIAPPPPASHGTQPHVVSNNSSEFLSPTPDHPTSEQHTVVTDHNQNTLVGDTPSQTRLDTYETACTENPTKLERSLEPTTQVQNNTPAPVPAPPDTSLNPQNPTNLAEPPGIDDTLPLRQSHAIEDVASLPSVIRRPAGSSPLKRKAEDALASEYHSTHPESGHAEAHERSNKRRNVEVSSTSPDVPADDPDASVGDITAAVVSQEVEDETMDAEQTPSQPESAILNDRSDNHMPSADQDDDMSDDNADHQEGLTAGSNSAYGEPAEIVSSQTRSNDPGIQSPDSSAIPRKSAHTRNRSKEEGDEQDGSEKKSETEYVLPPERPIPGNLPRVAKNRPENARVFIGNLASEYTDVSEIVKVFHKYGTLIEEPVLRRSFGFVQYSCTEAAKGAVQGEQGRMIGGIAIDLSIADNREVRKGAHVVNNTPFSHKSGGTTTHPARTGRTRERDGPSQPFEARKRRRSISPSASSRKGGVHPPQFGRQRPDPRNGVFLRILCMSPTARAYARHCEHTFRTMTALRADVLNIVAANLGEALGRAMRNAIPYVMVVASKDVEDGTCTIRTLEKTGYEKSGRGNGVIPLREAVEVCLIERGILVPTHIAQQGQYAGGVAGSGAPGVPGARAPVPGAGFTGRGGVVGTAQWLNQGNQNGQEGAATDSGKPSWMRGPRPPHPANMRMQGNGQTGALGQVGVSGGANPAAVPGFAYVGNEGGRGGGYAQGGLGLGVSPGMGATPQGMPAAGGRGEMFAPGYGNAANMAAVSSGEEFGRGNTQAYGGAGSNAGFSGRYGAQTAGGMRVGNFGTGGNREGEYDPASVVAGSRNAGGFGDWNREQGSVGREMFAGGLQGAVNGREHEGNAYGPPVMDGQSQQAPHQPPPFRGVGGYGNGNGVGGGGGSSQTSYGAERIGEHAAAAGVNESGQGAMYGSTGEMAGSQPGYDMRNVYGGAGYGEFAGSVGFRGGDSGANMAQTQNAQAAQAAQAQGPGQAPGRLDGQQGQQELRRYEQEQQAQGYNDGTGRGYQQYGGADVYGAREQSQRGGAWRNDGGSGGSGAMGGGMHGGMGSSLPSGGNAYGMSNRGDVRRSGGRNGAGGAGPTMDIDKLSNLITAFSQKQQQGGNSAPQAQASGQHPAHEASGGVRNNRGRDGNASNSTRLTPGGMSQILADPAVQQALQSIGGAGRLGGGVAGGSGGGNSSGAAGVASGGTAPLAGMWHGHGAQPSAGLGGNRDGRGDAPRNDGQQSQHGAMGASGQPYYR